MADRVPRVDCRAASPAEAERLLTREWLVANGLGGYASGTVAGVLTRRYHALLVAAHPAPLGRVVMLSRLAETLLLPDGRRVALAGEDLSDASLEACTRHLTEFRLELGLPVWRYEVDGVALEKRVLLAHGRNTVYVAYHLVGGADRLGVDLRPWVHFRPHHAPLDAPPPAPYTLTVVDGEYGLTAGATLPTLRLTVDAARADPSMERRRVDGVLYRTERARGYEATGWLWSPGSFRVEVTAARAATLVASTEDRETTSTLAPERACAAEVERRRRLLFAADPRARSGPAAELVLAADQFIVTPAGRVAEAGRAREAGDEIRTVVAGYHWFTDWGRDTMIGLEGLALVTGRAIEAGWVLRTFARHVRDGLVPNFFPEGDSGGLYHTADATLWFFHALGRYVDASADRRTLRLLLPVLLDIVDHHVRGTRFGIGVDPADGLLRQGAAGYQLTWMDAKVDDRVVTPRRGKAVEINALWYNALRLVERWVREERGNAAARPLAEHAARARVAFNARFWFEDGGYLYDVVDGEHGDDPACRPNQIFALSLDHPVLDPARWERVLAVVRERLLTPLGLRSLSPDHPEYRPRYEGDRRARDAAYHQGTVWAWLIGPFVDAWLRVHPTDRAGARRVLEGFVPHLGEAGLGSISEIFDAEPPFTPRGCIAQAWSVAEVLRAWLRTADAAGARAAG